jgi:cytochrome c553
LGLASFWKRRQALDLVLGIGLPMPEHRVKKTLSPGFDHGIKGVAMNRSVFASSLCAALVGACLVPAARAALPAQLLAGYSAQAGASALAERGQKLFTGRHGREWSCASCHGATPTQSGKHASTGKAIAALAPAFNSERFTDSAKTEKWFRRNCNDVIGRECTAGEKADVLAWLLTLKP